MFFLKCSAAILCFSLTQFASSIQVGAADTAVLQYLEITQSVQDDHNSVPLIAGKRTFLRAFFDYKAPAPAKKVRGAVELRRSSGATRTLDNLVSISTELDPALNGKLDPKRTALDRSLVFELPVDWTSAGDLSVNLTGIRLEDGTQIDCKCGQARTLTFRDAAPVRVVLLGMRFSRGGKSHVPREIDYKSVESWLQRAFPSSKFEIQTRVVDWSTAPREFDSGLKSCNIANAAITAFRKLDVGANSNNALFHYYGLVYYDGTSDLNFMRGCSSLPPDPDPSAVGSGPAGVGYAWDTSPSFAGWYAGHELGHTYGRHHPISQCGDLDESGGDKKWPTGMPLEKLGTAAHPFVAFDAGDESISQGITVWGWDKAADIMTYCHYVWPSAHNYIEICNSLAAENHMQCPLAPTPPGAGPPLSIKPAIAGPGGVIPLQVKEGGLVTFAGNDDANAPASGATSAEKINGPVLSLTGRIDLDNSTGEISAVSRLDRSIENPGPAGNPDIPVIKSYDAQGKLLSQSPATVLLDSDRAANDPHTGVVSGEIPYAEEIARLELVYKDKTLATRSTATAARPAITQPTLERPALQDLLRNFSTSKKAQFDVAPSRAPSDFATQAGVLIYSWQDQGTSTATYTVQISTNGGKDWNTVAVEIPQHSIKIDPSWIEGASTLEVRVRASNGIHETVSTSRQLDLTAKVPLQ
jgi:hypothetical protein